MSKKSHSSKNRAVLLVELGRMTDDEVEKLGFAMSPRDPRFGAVFHEYERRMPMRMQGLIDKRPASLSKEDAESMMQDIINPETINRFLDETPGARKEIDRITHAGTEETADQAIREINDRHAAQN